MRDNLRTWAEHYPEGEGEYPTLYAAVQKALQIIKHVYLCKL